MECTAKPCESWENYLFVDFCPDDAFLAYPVLERLAIEGTRLWYNNGEGEAAATERMQKCTAFCFILSKKASEDHRTLSRIIYAVGYSRPVMFVLAESFEKTVGLMMQLASEPTLDMTDPGFYDSLLNCTVLSPCRENKGKPSMDAMAAWVQRKQAFLSEAQKAAAERKKEQAVGPAFKPWNEPLKKPASEEKKELEIEEKEKPPVNVQKGPDPTEEKGIDLKEEKQTAREEDPEPEVKKVQVQIRKKEPVVIPEKEGPKEAPVVIPEKEEPASQDDEELTVVETADDLPEATVMESSPLDDLLEATVMEASPLDDLISEMTVAEPRRPRRDEGADETVRQTVMPAGVVRLETGELYRLQQIENIFGRKMARPRADILLDGEGFSSAHAVIFQHYNKFYIRDCGSKNHTYIAGVQVDTERASELPDCTEFTMWTEDFLFLQGESFKTIQKTGRIAVLTSVQSKERKYLVSGTLRLDRNHPWNDGRLRSNKVSHNHAVITMQSDGCTIRDVGSGNGTFLNGQRLEKNGNEEKLRPGDMIRLNTIDHLDYEYSEIVLDKGEVRT